MISPTGATDVANFEENYNKAKRYLTDNDKGVKNFLNDLKSKGLATYSDSEGWNIGDIDLKRDSRAMGIGKDFMSNMFGRLEDYGFHNNVFSTTEEGVQKLSEAYKNLFDSQSRVKDLEKNDSGNSHLNMKHITTELLQGETGNTFIDFVHNEMKTGTITADQIRSEDGKTFVDLVNGQIQAAKITTDQISGGDGTTFIDFLKNQISTSDITANQIKGWGDSQTLIDFVNNKITTSNISANKITGLNDSKTFIDFVNNQINTSVINVNGTTKNRPVGIRMSSYNEDKKSSIDIYDGTVDDGKPIVRMGYLDRLPPVNGENPTGYGFYAVGNAFFSGRIVSGSGKIGGFSLSDYKLVNDSGNNNVIGLCSTPSQGWAIWTGNSDASKAPFKVGHDGGLYATKATISGSITATSGKIGNCSIENGRLVLGDTMNYANLNANTYGNYGFKLVADGNNNPWFQHSPQRDIQISPVGYNSYKCNGGEWFRIEFEFASTVQATTTDNYGANTYVNINIGLYGKKTNGANCWFIPFGGRSNSSGTVQKVSTAVQLDSDVRSFSVCIQCAGSGTFSGTLKIRNVSVYRMMGNELIVDGAITAAKIRSGEVTANAIASNAITSDKISAGAITAAKIKSGEVTSDKIAANAITSDKITTNNIAGTNGWINLRSGTFKYNDGALAWDGSTMTIGGFKISKYKITNDAIGICSTAGQEWAFWAGASSGGNAPFHVGHNGELYASNATIGGIIRAKQSISVYNDTFATYQDVVKWDGSNLSIGLVGNAGSTGVKGAQIAFSSSQISVGNSSIVCGSISGTNSSFTNVWVENFTNASTFKENITCNKNLKVKGDFTFADYYQDILPVTDVTYRRPIASASGNKSRVAVLQGISNNKIVIKAQYNSTDFTNATFTGSSSDIRLKRDVKDSSVNALSKIMKMQIREFNWKQTGIHQELGCVADELELIDPLLTVGGGYDDDGTMNIKSIDTLLLSEYAIKGIQELYKQNKQQQKRIEYLESQLKNK